MPTARGPPRVLGPTSQRRHIIVDELSALLHDCSRPSLENAAKAVGNLVQTFFTITFAIMEGRTPSLKSAFFRKQKTFAHGPEVEDHTKEGKLLLQRFSIIVLSTRGRRRVEPI